MSPDTCLNPTVRDFGSQKPGLLRLAGKLVLALGMRS
jgi:hypothetical protein